jgi:hypothetical protein
MIANRRAQPKRKLKIAKKKVVEICEPTLCDRPREGVLLTCDTCSQLYRGVWNSKYCKDACRKKTWRERHKAEDYRKNVIARAKSRAAKKGCPFRLEIADLPAVKPTHCPVLGIELDVVSLDRIVPELGYVPGNVCLISSRANTLKNNGTLDEFRAIVEYIESYTPSRTHPSDLI